MLIVIALVAGFVVLYYGAEFLVKGGVRIAARLNISPLVIGLTLVAFGTSAPELLVSTTAALDGVGSLAVGNVVGSNICNIALILGASALIRPLAVNRQILKLDMPVMIGSAGVFALVYWLCGGVGRAAAAGFLLSLLFYTYWTIRSAKKSRQKPSDEVVEELNTASHAPVWASALLSLAGLLMLGVGSKLLVFGTVELARRFGISEAVISLTVVALGTSLPELATSVLAAIKRETDISVGNIVGSNIFNILAIIGVAPLLRPINAHEAGISPVDFAVMVLLSVALYPMMATKKTISRVEGVLLLAIYAGFTAYCIYRL